MNVLKILFNPVFLLAAGLHAGLLLIPVAGGSSEDVVPAPDPEGESITVTHIPLKKTAKGDDQKASGGQAVKASTKKGTANSNTVNKSDKANKSNSGSGSNNGSGNRRSEQQTTSRNVTEEISSLGSNSASISTPNPPANSTFNSSPSTNTPNASTNDQSSRPERSQQERRDLLAGLLEEPENTGGLDSLRKWLSSFWQRYYSYNEKGTTDAAVKEAEKNWFAALGEQQIGIALSTAPEPLEPSLTIDYPLVIEGGNGPRLLSRCLVPVPKDGVLGVVVNGDGNILPELSTVLRSVGYFVLDDVALDAVQNYVDFPAASDSQAHTVKVKVNYDATACASLSNLGVEPLEPEVSESGEPPAPPAGGRNFMEESEDDVTPFD